jgi:hypothetical protein
MGNSRVVGLCGGLTAALFHVVISRSSGGILGVSMKMD